MFRLFFVLATLCVLQNFFTLFGVSTCCACRRGPLVDHHVQVGTVLQAVGFHLLRVLELSAARDQPALR